MGFSDDVVSDYILYIMLIILGLTIYSLMGNPLKDKSLKYGYSDCDGPHVWREQFNIQGQNQSPVHIISSNVTCTEANSDLQFSEEFHHFPAQLRITNDGTTVVVTGEWCSQCPTISGGPLEQTFTFYEMRFRWGMNDDEGSEHIIDNSRYSMELQCFFSSCKDREAANNLVVSCLIVSYMLEETCTENPYLEPIINSLQFIRYPRQTTFLMPFPISLLAPPFSGDYYSYTGSLTYPPCTEGIRWIIQPEPLTVSAVQSAKFREICGWKGLILSNVRPVQPLNSRSIVYYT